MAAYTAKAQRHDWRTPPEVVAVVREALGGEIDLDPCASMDAPVEEWIGQINLFGPPERDGLEEDWRLGPPGREGVCRTVYVNPPFADNAKWIAKCAAEAAKGAEIVALIPARTDTRYWQDVIAKTADAICFWRGRIKFVGAPASAPFPVALVYWGPSANGFWFATRAHGHVVFPLNKECAHAYA